MDLLNKRVQVISGCYQGIKGTVTGIIVDNYYLIKTDHHNSFFAEKKELSVIS